MNWFNKDDIKIPKLIKDPFIKNIKGYVIPHAGTKYSGNILSHTLRFYPNNYFEKIIIIYYPANNYENIILSNDEKYFHEYYVPMKTLQHICSNIWKYGKKNIIGINLSIKHDPNLNHLSDLNKTLVIVSADFSHFLPMQKAIELENLASHTIMHNYFPNSLDCINIIDHVESFKLLYKYLPTNYNLQWIGRTRSPGEKGVGYLSFIIKKPQGKNLKFPHGMFVTAYDANMYQRECLGEWFNKKYNYTKVIEKNLINKVINLAKTTSRLTGGNNISIPVTHYTITYLYKTSSRPFIRGYHGIKSSAFFLSDVMLENTYNNGIWINKEDSFWKYGNKFNLNYTLNKIKQKAKKYSNKFTRKLLKNKYKLYYSDVVHKKI